MYICFSCQAGSLHWTLPASESVICWRRHTITKCWLHWMRRSWIRCALPWKPCSGCRCTHPWAIHRLHVHGRLQAIARRSRLSSVCPASPSWHRPSASGGTHLLAFKSSICAACACGFLVKAGQLGLSEGLQSDLHDPHAIWIGGHIEVSTGMAALVYHGCSCIHEAAPGNFLQLSNGLCEDFVIRDKSSRRPISILLTGLSSRAQESLFRMWSNISWPLSDVS